MRQNSFGFVSATRCSGIPSHSRNLWNLHTSTTFIQTDIFTSQNMNVQVDHILCQGYIPAKHCTIQTQNSHLKQDICWRLTTSSHIVYEPIKYINAAYIHSLQYTYMYTQYIYLRGGDDKSLVRPTSRCCRTKSIVSLERGVCSCGELQVFSCYRGWKEACQVVCVISTTSRRKLSSSFFSWKAPKEIHAILTETLGEHAPSYTVKNWVAQFKHGDFSNCDAPRPGWPKTVTTPEIIDQIHELILEDRQISAKSIAEELGISHERVGSITHEDLDMRKLSTKWVLKCLNMDQKHQQCHSSEQLLEFFFWHEPNDFLSRLVIMDETWLYYYDPETKQQSMEWWHSGSPRPKNFWVCKNPLEKFSPHWLCSEGPNYQCRVLLISAGATEGHFKGKTMREGHWRSLKVVNDNAMAHWALATQEKLAYLGLECLDHPPYSPDLALSY